MEDLKALYKERGREIQSRLRDFEMMGYRPDKAIFAELCFCLLAAGNKALQADLAVRKMVEDRVLFSGTEQELVPYLEKRVRFHNHKAGYIAGARKFLGVKKILAGKGSQEKRAWLVEHIPGMGWKEASHFLRNIGQGQGIAIIDRHILRSLKEYGVIPAIPKSMTKKQYLEIEEKIRDFSGQLGIPMEELDLLLWLKGTGRVFK